MLKIPENELEILEFWKKNNTFQKSLEKESPNGDYVFYDGPPFATGLPHYGHILSSVIKDVVPRYWTMKGYHVRRRWGWDCHGLPIETLVEQQLKISGKKQIEEMGVDKFNETCRAQVLTYTEQWKDMVERIGRWVEFDNSYKTMDTTYMESVWWALKKLWDDKRIYEGRKVLMYCPRCETPVSKFEVAMDNSYKDVTDTAVTAKFKVTKGKGVVQEGDYILAWTTTPWTLPGNVALAVGENIEYVRVEKDGEFLILAKERLEALENPKILETISGSDLIGIEYEPLYDIPAVAATGKKSHYIAAANFVTTEDGTGIVHTAVIYGEDDFNLGQEIDLPMVPLLDSRGLFNEEAPKFVQGTLFKDAEPAIIEDLKKRKLLFSEDEYQHPYPHCWRCEHALFYNAITAWFIDIQSVKDKLLKYNEKINWFPEYLKHGRFQNNVEGAPDWNISRNRYWATALPFWKCDAQDCTETVCIGSIAELKAKATNFDQVYTSDSVDAVDLHKHVIDKVKLKCSCGDEMTRIPEVIDSWVEAASMPYAEYHYPFENEEEFKQRFPGDYIAEYIAQTRTWFYYMHAMAVLLFDDISFKNVVTTGTILNEKGEKMSKSKRNFPDPWEVINLYGVDALRFHLMSSVVMQSENLNFNEREVRDVYNKLINALYNSVTFYNLFAKEGDDMSVQSDHIMDTWILSKLHETTEVVTKEMDGYNTVKASRPLLDFVQELSTWYIRRSRDRFKSADDKERIAAVATLHHVLKTLSQLLAPFTPFAAEHVWAQLNQTEESVHLSEWPKTGKVDQNVLNHMQVARDIVEKAHALRAEAGIKVRQPLQSLQIESNLAQEYLDIIAEEVNVKSVTVGKEMMLDTELTDELKAEGALRELIRVNNALRKKARLKPSDRVLVQYSTDSAFLKEKVIVDFAEELKQSTAQSEWKEVDSVSADTTEEAKINGEAITIGF